MKKLTLILLLLSLSVFAQKPDGTKKQLGLVIKGDILMPILLISNANVFIFNNNYCSFTLEKLLKKRRSIQLTFFEDWGQWGNPPIPYYIFNKWALLPEYKFFVSKKKAHTGYYVGVWGQFMNDKEINQRNNIIENYKTVYLGGGISTGVQFYIFKRITIDALIGFGVLKPIYYYDTRWNVNGIVQQLTFQKDYYTSQFNPRLAINIGYKF